MKKIFTSILSLTLFMALGVFAQSRVLAPQLTAPEDGSRGSMPDVVLDWNAVAGSTGIVTYEIQLDTDGSFSNPQVFETELVTGISMSELSFAEDYFWRVRAHDGNDVSDWSETWTFTVITRPVITKPSETVVQSPDPVLEWNLISGVDFYDYQLDTVYYWNKLEGLTSADLFAAEALSETEGWLFGANGLVLFYNGDTVVEQETGVSDDLLAAFFLASDNGWAAGEGGTILHFDGTVWSAVESNSSATLRGLFFLAADNGYAVGDDGAILHYDGIAWSEQSSGSTRDLYAVQFADASNGWVTGKTGTILYFDGASWSSMTSNTTRDLYCLGLTGEGTAWAAGKSGTFVFYDGAEWTVTSAGVTTKDINSMEFIDANNAWAAGDGGTLLSFDGFEWARPSSTTAADLFGISFANADMGWLVGEEGNVLVFDNESFTSPMAVLHAVEGSLAEKDLVNLLFGTRYYWRLRARHGQDTSAWSAPLSFSTIAAPELEDPSNGSSDEHLDLVLKWKKISDHVEYQIEVDDDPEFGSPIFMTTEEKEIEAEMLKFGLLYNWRVKAVHANDESDWSAVWQFETINSIDLSSPSNGSTDIEIVPTLTWDEIGGVEEYQLQLGTSDMFTAPLVDEFVPAESASLTVPVVLAKNTTYYWRVRAVNGLDSTNYSATWSFTTVPPVGIDEPGKELKELMLYPNPARDFVTVSLNIKEATVLNLTVTDLLGKEMIRESLPFDASRTNHKLNVSNLSKGIYMLRLDNGSSTVVRKLIIER